MVLEVVENLRFTFIETTNNILRSFESLIYEYKRSKGKRIGRSRCANPDIVRERNEYLLENSEEI
jgi:hypothetical protein